MTVDDIKKLIEFADYRIHTYNQRTGQALMNSLYDVNEDVYKEFEPTNANCFYEDENVKLFYEKLSTYIKS